MANDIIIVDQYTAGKDFTVFSGNPAAINRVVVTATARPVNAATIAYVPVGRVTVTSSASPVGIITRHAVGRVTVTSSVSPLTFDFDTTFSLVVNQDIEGSAYKHRILITQEIQGEETFSLPIIQDVIGEVNVYSIPITQSLSNDLTASLPIVQNVIEVLNEDGTVNNDPYDNNFPEGGYTGVVFSPSEDSGAWGVEVYIGGIDVSAVVMGEIVVNKEADQAQVASFSILDTDLSDAIVNTWNLQTVAIIFQVKDAVGNVVERYPLFSGSIAGYTYQAVSGIFSFTASDDLQSVVRDLYTSGQLLPPAGYFFKDLEEPEGADGWAWLQAAMTTVPMSFGLNSDGNFQYYPWYNPNGDGLVFSTTNIIDGTLAVTLQDSKSIVNFVDVNLYEKYKSLMYVANGEVWGKGDRDFQLHSDLYRTLVYCQESLDSYGIHREKVEQTETADYTNSLDVWTKEKTGTDGEPRYLYGSEMAALILGANDAESTKFTGVCPIGDYPGQDDPYVLKVKAFYNLTKSSLRTITYEPYYVDGEFVGNDPTVVVGDGVEQISGTGGDLFVKDIDELALCKNHAEVALVNRDLVAEAEKRIQETHRQTLVTLSSLIIPSMSWGSGAVVNTPTVKATGRVHSVTHSLNATSGSATTSVSIKIPHAGKFVTAYQDGSFGTGVTVSENIQCSTDGKFDKVVYAEHFTMTFDESIVSIPTTNIDIGKY